MFPCINRSYLLSGEKTILIDIINFSCDYLRLAGKCISLFPNYSFFSDRAKHAVCNNEGGLGRT